MTTARKQTPAAPTLFQRTPLAEWAAAGVGLILTLAVLGYSILEAVRADGQPPRLTVEAQQVDRMDQGWLVKVKVANASTATAASVRVRGVLRRGGVVVEEGEATFDYVPGRGSARGGLMFRQDPQAHDLSLRVEAYSEP